MSGTRNIIEPDETTDLVHWAAGRNVGRHVGCPARVLDDGIPDLEAAAPLPCVPSWKTSCGPPSRASPPPSNCAIFSAGGPSPFTTNPSSRICLPPAIFVRTEWGKHLIWMASIMQPRLKSAVVKTYPVPSGRSAQLDLRCHVTAEDPEDERRQDARLLERRREQACRGRARRAATRAVFGRDQFSQAAVWRKAIEVLDDDAGNHARWRCSRRTAVPASRPMRRWCSFCLRRCGYAGRGNGAPVGWLGSCGRHCSWINSGPIVCHRAVRARSGITRSCRCWSHTG